MDRLEDVFKAVFEDESTIRVKDVAESFGTIMLYGEKNLNSFRNVKNKVTEGEWNVFVNSIATSFLSSVYVNASPSEEERNARLAEVAKATEGLLKGVFR